MRRPLAVRSCGKPVLDLEAGYPSELAFVGSDNRKIQSEYVRCDEQIVRTNGRAALRQLMPDPSINSIGRGFQWKNVQCVQDQVDAVSDFA